MTKAISLVALLFIMISCGGGGGDSSSTTGTTPLPTLTLELLNGTYLSACDALTTGSTESVISKITFNQSDASIYLVESEFSDSNCENVSNRLAGENLTSVVIGEEIKDGVYPIAIMGGAYSVVYRDPETGNVYLDLKASLGRDWSDHPSTDYEADYADFIANPKTVGLELVKRGVPSAADLAGVYNIDCFQNLEASGNYMTGSYTFNANGTSSYLINLYDNADTTCSGVPLASGVTDSGAPFPFQVNDLGLDSGVYQIFLDQGSGPQYLAFYLDDTVSGAKIIHVDADGENARSSSPSSPVDPAAAYDYFIDNPVELSVRFIE
ncbi:MAG: hypothetical protein H6620_07310 [Halobacteriovoraceae bacterium]|nr:hypothetical protein [Halobacteriovoraceae bacterium]